MISRLHLLRNIGLFDSVINGDEFAAFLIEHGIGVNKRSRDIVEISGEAESLERGAPCE